MVVVITPPSGTDLPTAGGVTVGLPAPARTRPEILGPSSPSLPVSAPVWPVAVGGSSFSVSSQESLNSNPRVAPVSNTGKGNRRAVTKRVRLAANSLNMKMI